MVQIVVVLEGMTMKILLLYLFNGFEKSIFWSYMVLLEVLACSWLSELPVFCYCVYEFVCLFVLWLVAC